MREKPPLSLSHLFLSLLLMALISFLPNSTPNNTHATVSHSPRPKPSANGKSKRKKKSPPPPPHPKAPSSSWEQFKSLLSCKNTTSQSQVHAPSPIAAKKSPAKLAKLTSTCGSSICAIRDVVHSTSSRVTDNGSSSDGGGSHATDSTPLSSRLAPSAPSSSSGRMQLMKLSGCYECHAVDAHSASRRYPRPRTLCPCPECGEVFTKTDSLELHQATRHAVSELGTEDSGRNIVEIIFKSSWQKREGPICTVERILKVHNTQRTIARFEDYRDAVKARAQAHLLPSQPKPKNPRCAADGNELLRFHCTSLSCPLGSGGSTSLCPSPAGHPCSVCTVIRHGFSRAHQGPQGVRTTASSGRAHDGGPAGRRRAMLVCRVIAGRVGRCGDLDVDGSGPFDSVAGDGSVEELFVANPRAILPCFVVIYKALD